MHANRGKRPRLMRHASLIICLRTSYERLCSSPVVPNTKRPCTPPSIKCSISRSRLSTSSVSLLISGVTSGGMIPLKGLLKFVSIMQFVLFLMFCFFYHVYFFAPWRKPAPRLAEVSCPRNDDDHRQRFQHACYRVGRHQQNHHEARQCRV